MRKSASIYFNQEYTYLSSESIHKRGLLFMTPPFVKVVWKELSIEDKYKLIMNVLKASNAETVFKKDIVFEKEFFKIFGFKSWRQFNKNTKLCRVSIEDEKKKIEIIPTEFDGSGYLGLPAMIKTLSTDILIEEFVESFEEALLVCK
jgi:hypothetical protein